MSCVQNIGLILCNFDVAAYTAVWIAIRAETKKFIEATVAAYTAVWIAIGRNMNALIGFSVAAYTAVWIAILRGTANQIT